MKNILLHFQNLFQSSGKKYSNILILFQILQFHLYPWGKQSENFVFIDFFEKSFFENLPKFIHDYKIVLTANDFEKIKVLDMNTFNIQNIFFYNYNKIDKSKIVINFISKKNNNNFKNNKIFYEDDKAIDNYLEKFNKIQNKNYFGCKFHETREELNAKKITKTVEIHDFFQSDQITSNKFKVRFLGNYEKSLVELIKKYSKNYNNNFGKVSYLSNIFVFNNLVIKDKKIIENSLKFNDLAQGSKKIINDLNLANRFREILKNFFRYYFLSNKYLYFKACVSGPPLAHWLIDVFIPFLNLRQKYSNIKMIYDFKLTEYQKYYLKLFNINEDDILIIDKHKKYFFKNIIFNVSEKNLYPEFCFNSLHSKKILPKINSAIENIPDVKKFEKIYVSRRDALNARILINEDEIERKLIEENFNIVNASKYNHVELLSIFKNAKIIVGPLGSGLLNSFFSKQLKYIISLSSTYYYEEYLPQILSLKEVNYINIIGETLASFDIYEGGARNSNFYIDPDKIISCLKKCI